jgi:hypothetical protein
MIGLQEKAILSALTFLASAGLVAGLLGLAALAALIGNDRLARAIGASSRWLLGGRGVAAKAGAAAAAIATVYLLLLFGFSIASRDRTLAPGQEKYFCEIDCHLAYAVTSAEYVLAVGAAPAIAAPRGEFLRVALRTRFDETTISARRPKDFSLSPTPRQIYLVDEAGNRYPISAVGERALEGSGQAGSPMTRALLPGESYTSNLVFEVPARIRAPRLLVLSPTFPEWFGSLLLGDENSLLHAKVYLPVALAG